MLTVYNNLDLICSLIEKMVLLGGTFPTEKVKKKTVSFPDWGPLIFKEEFTIAASWGKQELEA